MAEAFSVPPAVNESESVKPASVKIASSAKNAPAIE